MGEEMQSKWKLSIIPEVSNTTDARKNRNVSIGCNIWKTIRDLNESSFYDSVPEEEGADLQRVEK